jgi:hypothetical protein
VSTWVAEAATIRRVDGELSSFSVMVSAATQKNGPLILTDNQDKKLEVPQSECTPHVVAHILCVADFGDYERLLRLVEDNARLTFSRDDDGVTYLASGRTL